MGFPVLFLIGQGGRHRSGLIPARGTGSGRRSSACFLHLIKTQILQASNLPKTCLQQAGARRQGRRRTTIRQVLANAVPPPGGINPALPQGKLFSKTGRIRIDA
ncbi:MAG: hypothetical protein DRH37_05545 [Deltaproteobacteria bacterium]|nr:MAG: hypothetical protein DRH37_05545 [Deltaproteobacteria bacterium]